MEVWRRRRRGRGEKGGRGGVRRPKGKGRLTWSERGREREERGGRLVWVCVVGVGWVGGGLVTCSGGREEDEMVVVVVVVVVEVTS